MGEHPTIFRQRLMQQIAQSRFRSERSLAKAAKLSHSQIASMLRPRVNSKNEKGPGLFVTAAVCDQLGVGLDYLAGLENTGQPSISAIIQAWHNANHHLIGLKEFREYFLIFEPPVKGSSKLRINFLGQKSLAVRTTGIANRHFFQATMDLFGSKKERLDIVNGISKCCENRLDLSIQKLRVPPIQHLRDEVKLTYLRLLLCVVDGDGKELIVSYALEI